MAFEKHANAYQLKATSIRIRFSFKQNLPLKGGPAALGIEPGQPRDWREPMHKHLHRMGEGQKCDDTETHQSIIPLSYVMLRSFLTTAGGIPAPDQAALAKGTPAERNRNYLDKCREIMQIATPSLPFSHTLMNRVTQSTSL